MRPANELRKQACLARAEIAATVQPTFGLDRWLSRNAISSSQPVIVSSHVHEQRRDINQAVNPIQNSTVAGNGRAHVFCSDVTFNHTNGKIAQLPSDSDN